LEYSKTPTRTSGWVPVTVQGRTEPWWWQWRDDHWKLTKRVYFGTQYDLWTKPEMRALFQDVEVSTWLGKLVQVRPNPSPEELKEAIEARLQATIGTTEGILDAGVHAPERVLVTLVSLDSGHRMRTAGRIVSGDLDAWGYSGVTPFPYGGV